MTLVFRNCESTSGCGSPTLCPDRFCYPGQTEAPVNQTARDVVKQILHHNGRTPSNTDSVYTTLVWYYEWPTDRQSRSSKIQPPSSSISDPLSRCLPMLQHFEQALLLSKADSDAAVDAVLDGEPHIVRLCNSAIHIRQSLEMDSFVARQIARWIRV